MEQIAHATSFKKVLMSSGLTESAMSKSAVRSMFIRTWCTRSRIAYTLKSKDGTQIDFMCLTMIDTATSWFEVVELPVVKYAQTTPEKGIDDGKSTNKTDYTVDKQKCFDKVPVK